MVLQQPRRTMTRTIGVVAALAAVLGTTFGAVRAQGADHSASAKPAYGGSYAIRLGDPADCLDPQKTASASANEIDAMVFDPLLSVTPKGQYVGDLATKYHVSNGGKTLTFFLRKGVRFSNGDPFTAQDVKFTFDRAIAKATKSPVSASQLAGLNSTTVVNKYEVQLHMAAAYRPLLSNLAGAYLGILDKKSIQAQGSNTCNKPIGTGIYKIQSTGTAFSDVTLNANKYHNFAPSWVHNKGKPYITTVQWKVIASDPTAISELLSGGVQLSDVPGTQLTRVKGNKSVVIHKLAPQGLDFLEFNTAHAPFNNPQVRKAVAEIINRSAIVKAALGGQGKAIYGPLPPGIPFYDKSAGKLMPKYNLSDATKIIQANHATGPYNLMIDDTAPFNTIAEIIQQSAAQAGMKLNIDSKGSLADFIPAAAQGNFDMLMLSYAYNDPDILYLLLDSSQGGGNGLNWTNEKNSAALDALLTKGRTTLQKKKVRPIYDQAQQLINKQLDFIGMSAPTSLEAVRSNIKGFHYSPNGGFAFQDFYIKTK